MATEPNEIQFAKPQYDGVYICQSSITVELMYIAKDTPLDSLRVRQRLVREKGGARAVIDESLEDLKSSDTWFRCRPAETLQDESLAASMKRSGVQFSFMRDSFNPVHSPGFTIYDDGYNLKVVNLSKQKDKWVMWGEIEKPDGQEELRARRHPMGSRFYRFVPFLDDQCQWHLQKEQEEASVYLYNHIEEFPKNMRNWFINLLLDFTFGNKDFDGFLDKQINKKRLKQLTNSKAKNNEKEVQIEKNETRTSSIIKKENDGGVKNTNFDEKIEN